MAGIARRNRPRRWSWRMRRLRWVMLREATICVLRQLYPESFDELAWRKILASQDTHRVERHLGILLVRHPYTRHYPPYVPLSAAERTILGELRAAEHPPR